MSKMNAKDLGFARKKIHPHGGKNSAANLLFNTHTHIYIYIYMYTKDPAQVRISKEGKLQIFDRI